MTALTVAATVGAGALSLAASSVTVAPTASVGGFPTGLAIDTSNNTIYVANGAANALSIIGDSTCNATTTAGCASTTSVATAGQDPIGVAVDEQTGTVYAVNGGSNTVAVIDANTCNADDAAGCASTPTLVSVPAGPEFLAIDSATNTVYVANTSAGTVSVIDGNTCNAQVVSGCSSTIATVPVGAGAFPIAVDEATNTVYVGINSGVAVFNGDTCDAANTSECSLAPTVLADSSLPAGIAVDDLDHTIYVSGEAGTVSLIDSSSCNGQNTTGCTSLVSSVSVGSDPRGDVYDPATNTVYVTNEASNTVSLINTSTCNATTTAGCASTPSSFPAGNSPRRVAVDPSSDTLYVVNTGGDNVSVVGSRSCNASVTSGCPTQPAPGATTGPGVAIGGGSSVDSTCSPTTNASTSGGPATEITNSATEVASGTVDGMTWSLWSENGQSGATALEDGGLVLNGAAYGLCPGFPNPAELEMIDAGQSAVVYGVIGYAGLATVNLSVGTAGSFTRGAALPASEVQVVNGVSFFIGALPNSACSYSSLELDATAAGGSSQHNLGFGGCVSNEIVPITSSQGAWGSSSLGLTTITPVASAGSVSTTKPLNRPAPNVRLSSTSLPVRADSADVSLWCLAVRCSGTLKLEERVTSVVHHGKTTKLRLELVLLGSTRYATTHRRAFKSAIALTRAGSMALDSSKQHALSALLIEDMNNGATVSRQVKVT